MLRSGANEVHESGATVELGEKDGSVALGLGVFDPLQTRSDATVPAAAFSQHSAAIAAHPHFSLAEEEQEQDEEQRRD